MKKTKNESKLKLYKMTISTLTNRQMNGLAGGYSDVDDTETSFHDATRPFSSNC